MRELTGTRLTTMQLRDDPRIRLFEINFLRSCLATQVESLQNPMEWCLTGVKCSYSFPTFLD